MPELPAFNLGPPPTPLPGKVILTVDDILYPYIWVFYAAFLVAFMFTPVFRRVAIMWGIIDKPDGVRKMHREAVAYLGGAAVFLGWLCGVSVSQICQWHVGQYAVFGLSDRITVPPVAVFGATLVVLLGLWDDIRHIKPIMKIVVQVAAACMLLWAGFGRTLTAPFVDAFVILLLNYTGLEITKDLQFWIVAVSSFAFTIAIVVFCCNAANLMDGLDGLCSGVTAIIAIGFVLLSIHIAQFPQLANPASVNRDALRVVLGLALLGSVLGFIPFNFNPASIFMGDAGSLFLGFSCAFMIILLGEQEAKWLLAGLVMFALPVLDTALAFARRKIAGRKLFSPDKQHLHHQLVARGLSVKQAVLTAYALAIFFVLLGLAVIYMRTRYAGAIYLVLFCGIIVAAYKMGMIHEKVIIKRVPPRRESPEAESGESKVWD
ncbi:MAG TPA: MraY family glycosyltransferase [Tepidisphaeraceae bacterium]|nr:MraY family glycosyltransferase [Tepidisphaeraceae bacterium]